MADRPKRGNMETFNRGRRRLLQNADQAWVRSTRRLRPSAQTDPFDGDARFALLTVNYSTTRWLKLMLVSLADQDSLGLLRRIVICDNDSKDGGKPFLHMLAATVPKIHLVTNSHFTNHARGMRRCLSELDRLESNVPVSDRSNILLSCDPDVVYLRPDTLKSLARVFETDGAAFAGELRHGLYPYPEAQSSFLAVRRDWASRPGVSPWVHHGAPSYFQQRDIWRLGGSGVDFPSNKAGFALHRGRTAVAASRRYAPFSPYGTAPNHRPHYMGTTDGARTWSRIETELASWTEPEAEPRLVAHLANRLR